MNRINTNTDTFGFDWLSTYFSDRVMNRIPKTVSGLSAQTNRILWSTTNQRRSTRVELIRCCTDAEIPLLLSFASAKHDTLPSIRCGRFIPERNRACVYSWKVKVSNAAAGFHQEAENITSSAAWFKGVINYQPGAQALRMGSCVCGRFAGSFTAAWRAWRRKEAAKKKIEKRKGNEGE